MTKFLNFGKSLWQDEDGATAIEYGLLAALISVAIILAVTSLGETLTGVFEDVDAGLGLAASAPAPPLPPRKVAGRFAGPDDLLRSGACSSMRIFLVILAALIVAGGTGFYVLQGLRPAAPEVAQAAAPQLRQVFVPASQVPIGTIITPEWLSRMDITEGALNGEMIVADAAGQEFLAGSVARQVLPQGRSDRPFLRRAARRPRLSRRRAAQGHARDHHSHRRGRRAERPGASRRPGGPDPDLFGRRRRYSRQRDGDLQPAGAGVRPAARAGGAAEGQGGQGRRSRPSPGPRRSRSRRARRR